MTFETSTASPTQPASGQFLWGMAAEPGNAPLIFAMDKFLFRGASGNVGLGTGAPSALFHAVLSQDAITETKIVNANTTSNAAVRHTLATGTSNSFMATTLYDNAGAPYCTINCGAAVTFGSVDANEFRVRSTTGTGRFTFTATELRPVSDNVMSCATAAARFTVVYAATGTINTSDERAKDWLGAPGAAHLRAARRIGQALGLFRWIEEVARKGDLARIHFGPRAQAVARIMIEEGLEAEQAIDLPPDRFIPPDERPSFRHAFLCFDTWEEEREPILAPGEVEVEQEVAVIAGLHEDGRPIIERRMVTRTEQAMIDTGETRLVVAAGNRFGLRADQLALFLIAGQEARIAALEAAAGL